MNCVLVLMVVAIWFLMNHHTLFTHAPLKRGQSRQDDGPHGSALSDRRVLRLVRSYLTAGVLADGLF